MGRRTKTSRAGYGRPCSSRLLIAAVCTMVAAMLAAQARATSSTHVLKARLTRTASTVHAAHAEGAFTAKLTIAGKNSSFTSTLTFSHLSGAAIHAGIYFGKTAKPFELALSLCNSCSSGAETYYHGSYVASRRFVRAALHGGAWVVIQTKGNPKGEVLGQIKVEGA
jgi:hypothetical protein